MLGYVKMYLLLKAVVHMDSNSHLYVKKTWMKILFNCQNTELIPEARFSCKERAQELGDSFGIPQI